MSKMPAITRINDEFSIAPQVPPEAMTTLANAGFRSIICNRPDGEAADQPAWADIEAAASEAGLEARWIPVVSGRIGDSDIDAMAEAMRTMPRPILAFCRSGARSSQLWALGSAGTIPTGEILASTGAIGQDLSALEERIDERAGKVAAEDALATGDGVESHEVVIIGAGAAGIATCASLLARDRKLDVVLIDPADVHYYQPGWTMVGGGVFKPEVTVRPMESLIPYGARWIKASVSAFQPEQNRVELDDGRQIGYRRLIVCPGLKLNWAGIDGLEDTLGKNGVTSNYGYQLAPETWRLVQSLERGKALFTQPPMPIKCAGAPQKAMYLSSDYWRRHNRLDQIDVHFFNAGGVLFGVKDYVPALQAYIERYGIDTHYFHNLVAVDGEAKKAHFKVVGGEREGESLEMDFDMMHVVPPQCAPDFIRHSPLADEAGWVDVDLYSLQHKRYSNIWGLGDCTNTTNAKTAAAARKQAPVVADNVIADRAGKGVVSFYDGYGSCPLTVERGKIVLAEFGYGGKVLPSFPNWLIDGTKPSKLSWMLKAQVLPAIYWSAMLKGREWLAAPLSDQPGPV